jgi:hypothetical protein
MENLNDFVYKNISQYSDNHDCGNSRQHSCQYFEHYSEPIPFRLLSTGAFSNQFVDSDDKYMTVSRLILNEILMTKNITIVRVNASGISTSNSLAIVSILKNPSSASNNPGIFEYLNSSTRSLISRISRQAS